MIRLELPVPTYKSGSNALMSMNVYRNLHHHLLNKFKREYGDKIKELLDSFDPFETSVSLSYELQFKGNKRVDVMNVGSMIDKVFSDCLVESGLIEDDSVQYIQRVVFTGSNGHKENRVFVTLHYIEE
jgi:hypothetical protein